MTGSPLVYDLSVLFPPTTVSRPVRKVPHWDELVSGMVQGHVVYAVLSCGGTHGCMERDACYAKTLLNSLNPITSDLVTPQIDPGMPEKGWRVN